MKQHIVFLFFLLGTLRIAEAAVFEYLFENFETDSGWTVGPVSQPTHGFELLQGKAKIRTYPEDNSSQILELEKSSPYSVFFLDASDFTSHEVVYCEILVKPSATDDQIDEEFLDFGGAILGFSGDARHGRIHVLSTKSEDESVWISTGIDFPLDSERRPKEWIQVRIRIDRKTQRWSLAIDGEWVLDGLKALNFPSKVSLPLIMYGHTQYGNLFDDILLSNLPPSEVEEELARHALTRKNYQKTQHASTHDKFVLKTKPNSTVRHAEDSIRTHASTGPVLRIRRVEYTLRTATRTYTTDTEKETPVIAYSPEYDEKGSKKEAMLTVKADAYLEPGLRLGDLKWRLVHLKGWPDEYGETFATGDFRTGLVQQITIKPAWQNVATSIIVGAQPD